MLNLGMLGLGPKEITLTGLTWLEDGVEKSMTFEKVTLSGDDVLTVNIKSKLYLKMSLNRELAFGMDTNGSRAERRRKEREMEKKLERPMRLIELE
jgi:hypothetical protein